MERKEQMIRLSMTEEKYIEIIESVVIEKGYARVADIAKALAVKSSSVSEMLKKLVSKGFVEHTPYRFVTLTQKGKSLAIYLKQQQKALHDFLKLLCVEDNIAQKDACRMQHFLEGVTLKRFSQFVQFLQTTEHGKNCVMHFKQYLTEDTCFIN